MKLTHYPSKSRGLTATGWLVGKHMFSFGEYLDVQRMRFGSLRVFNDDLILPGTGFGRHPHDNMEIITIVLQGAVRHEDSMGNTAVVSAGEVQTMSAGSGVVHAEMNASESESLKLLQIWIDTETRDIKPTYDQKPFASLPTNTWTLVAGPDKGNHAQIHQQAWVYRAPLAVDASLGYTLKKPATNGLFLFVIDGLVQVGDVTLERGDGLGVREVQSLDVRASSAADVVLIEMPL